MALFTSETARAMAIKGAQMRLARRQALAAIPLEAAQAAPSPPDYATLRKSCVRAQLARLDAMLLTETDPQRLDRLAAAQQRLSEQERILDGRPLPGQRRPGRERVPAMTWTVEPITEAPAPAPITLPQVAPITEAAPGTYTPPAPIVLAPITQDLPPAVGE